VQTLHAAATPACPAWLRDAGYCPRRPWKTPLKLGPNKLASLLSVHKRFGKVRSGMAYASASGVAPRVRVMGPMACQRGKGCTCMRPRIKLGEVAAVCTAARFRERFSLCASCHLRHMADSDCRIQHLTPESESDSGPPEEARPRSAALEAQAPQSRVGRPYVRVRVGDFPLPESSS
jgi:hypothetical protein